VDTEVGLTKAQFAGKLREAYQVIRQSLGRDVAEMMEARLEHRNQLNV